MSIFWKQDGEDLVLVGLQRKFGGREREIARFGQAADGAPAITFQAAAAQSIVDADGLFDATTLEGALAEVKTLADAGMTVQKRTVTVGHADLTDADGSQDINIGAALPANSRIVGVDIHTLTAFSGGSVSALVVDIGSSGDVDALVDGADLFSAAVDGGPATRPAGIRPNKTFAAGGQLTARFLATGDTLANLTAGAVTIDVLFAVLA